MTNARVNRNDRRLGRRGTVMNTVKAVSVVKDSKWNRNDTSEHKVLWLKVMYMCRWH
jgi:hypothetical protein